MINRIRSLGVYNIIKNEHLRKTSNFQLKLTALPPHTLVENRVAQ